MKNFLFLLLSLLCVVSLCACDGLIDVNFSTDVDVSILEQNSQEESVPPESVPEEDIVIGLMPDDVVVFLGDSIAQGYLLENPEKERYSTIIAEKTGCKVYNYAIPGNDSADLIKLLATDTCEQLENATVVVLSIGANNVLRAAEVLLPYYEQVQNGAAPESIDISETFDIIANGIQQFEKELPQIISAIRTVNTDAMIVIQTVYNPYRDFTEYKVEQNGLQLSFAAFSASCVIGVNDVINDNAKELGYEVCEVYEPFKEYEGNLINALTDLSNVDPHPNAEGHKLLAELVMSAIEEGQIP